LDSQIIEKIEIDLKERKQEACTGLNRPKTGRTGGICNHGNEVSVAIKCGQVLD
jgi:hypothetical protein